MNRRYPPPLPQRRQARYVGLRNLLPVAIVFGLFAFVYVTYSIDQKKEASKKQVPTEQKEETNGQAIKEASAVVKAIPPKDTRHRSVVDFVRASEYLQKFKSEADRLSKAVVPSSYPENIQKLKVGESSYVSERAEFRLKTSAGLHMIIGDERYIVRGFSLGNIVTGNVVRIDGFIRRLENDQSLVVTKVIEAIEDPRVEPKRDLEMAESMQAKIPAMERNVEKLKEKMVTAKNEEIRKAMKPINELADESFAKVAVEARKAWIEKTSKPALAKIEREFSLTPIED